jgi:hypothetical protein
MDRGIMGRVKGGTRSGRGFESSRVLKRELRSFSQKAWR